jgi:hypothetical protein
MTKLKEFRESAPYWMKISFLDALEFIDASKTNKFLPMLVKIMDTSFKNRFNNFNETKELINELERKLPHLKGDFDKLDVRTIYSFLLQYNQMPNHEMEIVSEFITMYEKHQIPNVDINQLKSVNELESIVNLVGIKNLSKEYSKQIHIDLDNEKWLVIRPLTYEASLKYGANTKWCTSAKHNPRQYFRYTEDGILVYCINKETGYKLAVHMWKENNKFQDLSFWNSVDDRIDSLTSEIDYDVFNLIKEMYGNINTKTNKEIGGEYWMKSYHNYEKNENESMVMPLTDNYEMEEQPLIINRRVRGYVPTDVEEAMMEPETEQSVARDYPSVNY